jgi:Family of unknown function (DUF5677)
MDSSANISYMLAGDPNSRFLLWLQAYIAQDRKQITNWEEAVSKLPEDEAEVHSEGIERRRERLAHYEQFVQRMVQDFSFAGFEPEAKKWPNVADRFKAIGESVSYRTAYARMSSQTHADAEDSISYIMARVLDDEQQMALMSSETIAFSEYLVHYGAQFYLEAAREYEAVFSDAASERYAWSIRVITTHMGDIGEAWGW